MRAICNDCGKKGPDSEDELFRVGWLLFDTWIQVGEKKAYIGFELCPDHAKVVSESGVGRCMEIFKEQAKRQGIDLGIKIKL